MQPDNPTIASNSIATRLITSLPPIKEEIRRNTVLAPMSGDASTYFKAGLKYRLYVFENFKPGERFRVASRSKSRMPGELLVAESLMHAQVASKSFRGKLLLTPTCSRNLDV